MSEIGQHGYLALAGRHINIKVQLGLYLLTAVVLLVYTADMCCCVLLVVWLCHSSIASNKYMISAINNADPEIQAILI